MLRFAVTTVAGLVPHCDVAVRLNVCKAKVVVTACSQTSSVQAAGSTVIGAPPSTLRSYCVTAFTHRIWAPLDPHGDIRDLRRGGERKQEDGEDEAHSAHHSPIRIGTGEKTAD